MSLIATDITVTFGGVRAVEGVSLELGDRELLGLVGPNGSGKTTLLNALSGVVPATGHLTIGSRPVRLGSPRHSWRAGASRVFQAPQTFTDLSCIENLLLGSADRSLRGLSGAWVARPAMIGHERRRWARAMDLLALVGLDDRAVEPSGLLTYGQCRLLELGRALMSEPQVLLLDEPSAGLNDAETDDLARLLREVHGTGIALLVIDHKVDFLDSLCDRLVVLELGRVIAAGPPQTVWHDERVKRAYLGVQPDA